MLIKTTPAVLATLLTLVAAGSARFAGDEPAETEVLVLGMIHGGHRASERYGLETLRAVIRAVDPDVVLCEIPPDRFDAARDQFARTGEITEPRVRVFPEYVDALFPLSREMRFEIVPCAAWTKAMADDRRTKLLQWKTTRPAETARVEQAQALADRRIEAGGGDDDPLWIHTDAYDEIVREGMRPYDELFNDDLGAGGWTNINAAHYALVAKAIDQQRGRGRRVLIMFGAWHKGWFLEQLRKRDDVELLDPRPFFETAERGRTAPPDAPPTSPLPAPPTTPATTPPASLPAAPNPARD